MNKKIIALLVIVAIAILGLLMYVSHENSVIENSVTLNVSSEGPIPLQDIVKEIKSNDYFEGYDNETVEWMESLGNKYVFVSEDEYVIMNKWDADKIPSIYACDVMLYEIFSCNLLEKHSLGAGDNFKDVLLVNKVKYIREEAIYFDV